MAGGEGDFGVFGPWELLPHEGSSQEKVWLSSDWVLHPDTTPLPLLTQHLTFCFCAIGGAGLRLAQEAEQMSLP